MRWYSVLLLVTAAACSARGTSLPVGPNPEPDAGDDAVVDNDVPAFPDLPSFPDVPSSPDVVTPPVDNPPTCSAPRALCNGSCVDRSTDPNHCGACNNRCASGSCSGGSCVTTTTCPSPRVMCGATCTDVNTDAANCGLCGLRCASGQSCAGGNCVATTTCASPRRMCGTACTDVSTDPLNCGACARACAAGQTCSGGTCVTGGAASRAGAACTMPDPMGGMDPACGTDLVCIPTGTTPICTAGCEDDPSSQANERAQCGGTGSTCLTQGDAMPNSICAAACRPAGTTAATGACRSGFVCTGWWYTHAGGTPDTTGCFPFCSQNSDCGAGAVGSLCNARTGACGTTGVDTTRLPDGSPCNPTITVMVPGSTTPRNVQCRGICFSTSSMRPTEGTCGSFINLRVATGCPDDPTNITPRVPMGTDNLAICIFRGCSRNSDCRSPHICRYPEDATGMPVTDAPTTCDYPTTAQRTGTP